MLLKAPLLALLALGAPLLLAAPALAAGDDTKKDDTKSDASKPDDAKKDDADKDKDKDKAKPTDEDPNDPSEDPLKTYRFIGIRYRDAIVPKFIINWFANGGRNVNVPMVGPEFITRTNHLEIAVSLMYADYSMDPFLFQGKSDGPTTWNMVQSQLKLGYGMIDILYEIPLEKKGNKTGRFALLIGGGVGVAGVFGQLYRSQAYPNTPAAAGNTGNATQWSPCTGFGTPNASYCSSMTHVSPSGSLTGAGSYTENSWANGGSKPLIFPWIALPQVSFRYKPIKQFQMKADVGFSTSGFFFGVSASYGL